jgi:hypothetical protein
MSTEATLAPEPAPIVNDTLSAGDIMARFKTSKEPQPEPAPAQETEPAPTPKSEPAPATEPEPKVETPLDDSGVETPLNDLDAKPTETSTADGDDGPPGNATPAAKYKWGELRKKADEFDKIQKEILPQKEAELAEWKKKAEELSKSDPSLYQKQLEEKEAAIAEYEKKIAVFDIQSTKQYQEEIAQPLQKFGEAIAQIAPQYEVDPMQLYEAMNMLDPVAQDKRLLQLTEGMHPRHQNKIFEIAEQTAKVMAKAEELENNALEAKKEIEFLREQESKKAQETHQKEVQVAAESVKKQFLSKIDLLKDEELAKRVFNASLSPDEPVRQAYNAYAGELLPSVIKELHAARAKASELEKTLAARSAASPRAGGTGPAASAPPTSDQPGYEGETLWARMRSAMQS